MYSGMEWNGGRQLLMDDDILDGQQPGKREEGAGLGGQSSQKRREEEGRGQLRLLLCQAAPSFKVRRSSWRFLQGFSRGRPDRVRRPPSRRPAAAAFLRAGLSTVAAPTTPALTNQLIHFAFAQATANRRPRTRPADRPSCMTNEQEEYYVY